MTTLLNDVVYDCFLSLQPLREGRGYCRYYWQEAVDLRNNLFELVNNPAEKHDPSLIRKHYGYIRAQLVEKADELWNKLSDLCKAA